MSNRNCSRCNDAGMIPDKNKDGETIMIKCPNCADWPSDEKNYEPKSGEWWYWD